MKMSQSADLFMETQLLYDVNVSQIISCFAFKLNHIFTLTQPDGLIPESQFPNISQAEDTGSKI